MAARSKINRIAMVLVGAGAVLTIVAQLIALSRGVEIPNLIVLGVAVAVLVAACAMLAIDLLRSRRHRDDPTS